MKYRNGKPPTYKLKLSRNERASMEEKIDEVLEVLNVTRIMCGQKQIFIRKEKDMRLQRWKIYWHQSMSPVGNTNFMHIEVGSMEIKVLIYEYRARINLRERLPQYNWINTNMSLQQVFKGRRDMEVVFRSFEELNELINDLSKFLI